LLLSLTESERVLLKSSLVSSLNLDSAPKETDGFSWL